jgi:hypothetical protein
MKLILNHFITIIWSPFELIQFIFTKKITKFGESMVKKTFFNE